MATDTKHGKYFVPEPSTWPFLMTVGIFVFLLGFSAWLNEADFGRYVFVAGLAMILIMTFVWFRGVVNENQRGAYGHQEEMTFRWAMGWFIFSEVMFFAAFFGALFYARLFSVPWLGGEGSEFPTNEFLWQGYEAEWPTNGPGNIGGDFGTIPPWGVPFLNTMILLASGVTITWAHWGLKEHNRLKLNLGLAATVALGLIFLYYQAEEYVEAYQHLGLTMNDGIYGSTFFMLTGFHGMHVTLGTIMLAVILGRCLWGHFTPENHFAFEGVAWYWHFVDVVWLGLFVFVYIV